MTELNTTYPATQAPPIAAPGMVIHSMYDISRCAGSDEWKRYIMAETDEEKDGLLRHMPDATVTFYELRKGEPFFDYGVN